ncbi:gamma-glutamyltransferase [uncultured Proteiniphilum sp.]|uniref:gamma-glutamyltransferase family protein n=1 Tax=uncultured Proteiniphilum sp. TaxID=497637 RepID=UPI00262F5837|nr:gamma-glutamyltransferase [uncultured Proteiniphilum sp.]
MIKRYFFTMAVCAVSFCAILAQSTQKPPLHGKHWMSITGKPLAATAGSMIFQQGGNAVDAACAMLAATCTIWDVLSWGGETQALIYNPNNGKVLAINALGVAPCGATVSFFKDRGYAFPPEYGPLAAVTPGTPGGLCYMLAEYGTLSLEEVLAPAMEMARGYPMDAQTANSIERNKERIKEWPYSKAVFLPHAGEQREAPVAGEIFVQEDLLNTLEKMVEAEQQAIRQGKDRKEAIKAAQDRFYKGDIAEEFVRGSREQGGLIALEDLAGWKPIEEVPLHTTYKDIEVYKLQEWTQGPMLLQALNILENFDLQEMGYNSARYIHTIYQSMNLAFADRDFYYGDPYFSPKSPIQGLLSKEYARERSKEIRRDKNDHLVMPGNPYAYEGKSNPYEALLKQRSHLIDTTIIVPEVKDFVPRHDAGASGYILKDEPFYHADISPVDGYQDSHYQNSLYQDSLYQDRLTRGTTSIVAADKEGWVVSVTPSGGWIPACIAGRTGIGMSQRMQSFVLDSLLNPFNVVEPGKRPRVTLTPSLALKDGRPFLAFAVQGGDTQEQNLLQFFLNVVEFGMTVQQASEAANINSNQLWLSLGGTQFKDRMPRPGSILVRQDTEKEVIDELKKMGYEIQLGNRTSGPINAIFLDNEHGSFWGGSSNHGEDYGIGW